MWCPALCFSKLTRLNNVLVSPLIHVTMSRDGSEAESWGIAGSRMTSAIPPSRALKGRQRGTFRQVRSHSANPRWTTGIVCLCGRLEPRHEKPWGDRSLEKSRTPSQKTWEMSRRFRFGGTISFGAKLSDVSEQGSRGPREFPDSARCGKIPTPGPPADMCANNSLSDGSYQSRELGRPPSTLSFIADRSNA